MTNPVHESVVTVCDTGPGIPDRLLEMVFQRFVSTKPRGRGLGLYIARSVLEMSSHEIWATNQAPYRTAAGACLCIRFHDDAIIANPEIIPP